MLKAAVVARVHVLGHVVPLGPDDAAAKGDRAAPLVVDGKHHPLVEAVHEAARALLREVGGDQLRGGEAPLPQVRDQGAAPRGVAEVPATAHLRAKAAPREVAPRLGGPLAAPAHEHQVVEPLGLLERLDEAALARPAAGGALLGELDPGAVGQVANRVREVEVLAALHVGEDVAAVAAAKAVPQPRHGVDLEGGRLLTVEGAAAPELLPALPELHGLRDQLH